MISPLGAAYRPSAVQERVCRLNACEYADFSLFFFLLKILSKLKFQVSLSFIQISETFLLIVFKVNEQTFTWMDGWL